MGWHVRCAIGSTAQPKLPLQLFTFFRFGSDRITKLHTPALADMEAHSLQAASTYVNNILLARGLLKSGHPIDFAQPDNGDGGSEATMTRIINLVNDLVVRRDVSGCCSYRCRILSLTLFQGEAEHRENLATTIRTLRASESEQTIEIVRERHTN